MAASEPIAFVTGASSGIGRATARLFVERGYRVFGTSRQARPDEAGVEMLELDVCSDESVARGVAEALARAGRIDVLVNNAGFGLIGPAAELETNDVRAQLETNVVGPLALTRAVVPEMAARRSGRIVMIGSVSGVTATPFAGAYCGSKAALRLASDALRVELAPFGIHVVLVEPGAVESDFADRSVAGLARYSRPESLYWSVADAIERRARLSQDRPTPAAEAARAIADAVLLPRPPARLRVGRGALLLPLIGLLPRWLRDRLLARRFGLSRELSGPRIAVVAKKSAS
jgi:NAD(P)-dependent dehydrogenase (short-subunit alcohol dehydrogenase family)